MSNSWVARWTLTITPVFEHWRNIGNPGSQQKNRNWKNLLFFITVKVPEYTRSKWVAPSLFHRISHEPCKHCWLARHVSTAFRHGTCLCKVSHCTRSRGPEPDTPLSLSRSVFCSPVHPQVLTDGFSSSCSRRNRFEWKYQAWLRSKYQWKNGA